MTATPVILVGMNLVDSADRLVKVSAIDPDPTGHKAADTVHIEGGISPHYTRAFIVDALAKNHWTVWA